MTTSTVEADYPYPIPRKNKNQKKKATHCVAITGRLCSVKQESRNWL